MLTLLTLSNEYRDKLIQAHLSDNNWGNTGVEWGYLITGIAFHEGCRSILDYGCGKGTLSWMLRRVCQFDVREYDPGISGKDTMPEAADMVVACDVMEHVEPEYLPAVMTDLVRLTRKILFVSIATRPATQSFPDGSNYHLIINDAKFWRAKFEEYRFKMRREWRTDVASWNMMMRAPPLKVKV